jgi:hypothetical protein
MVSGMTTRWMMIVLANLRDVNLDRYDIVAGTNELAFRPYNNNHECCLYFIMFNLQIIYIYLISNNQHYYLYY